MLLDHWAFHSFVLKQNSCSSNTPVDQIEVVFAVVVDGVGVGVQVSGALGHQVFAVVGAECYGAVALPLQLEQGVRRSETIHTFQHIAGLLCSRI